VARTPHDFIDEEIILPEKDWPAEPLKSLKDVARDYKKGYLVRIPELTKGNVSKAAELSGKYRADFYDLLKKYHHQTGRI